MNLQNVFKKVSVLAIGYWLLNIVYCSPLELPVAETSLLINGQ
jgi:hypothetical protein